MTDKLIQAQFESFMKSAYPDGVPKNQFDDLRRTFFAGSVGTMGLISNARPRETLSMLLSIQRELEKFSIEVAKWAMEQGNDDGSAT